MNNPQIKPHVINGGSAFRNNEINNTRPLSQLLESDKINVVSLTNWCAGNFISKRIGRTLIKRKLLIAFRFKGQWWVASNPDCIEQLLEYLGVDKLAFDADNS